MERSNTLLAPGVRGALDDDKFLEAEPGLPALLIETRLLSADRLTIRSRADALLRHAGIDGVVAVTDFIANAEEYAASERQLVAAIRFIASSRAFELELVQQESIRAALGGALGDGRSGVRAAAAEVLGESLRNEVESLASDVPLRRIQATNRLYQADLAGIMATAAFLEEAMALGGTPEPETVGRMVAGIRFITSSDFGSLEPGEASRVRTILAEALRHDDGRVRVQAARALQVHGPGAQRTAFLAAIGDSETRVRWAVVRRFGDNPRELDKTQRSLLLTFLDAGTRADFESADKDGDEFLDRREYPPTAPDFDRLDRDGDRRVSLDEWLSPVPSEVRADVFALLLRLHGELTPDVEPTGYNPWLPSADQLERVRLWRNWNDEVSRNTELEDEG